MNHNKYGCKPPHIDVRDYKLAKSTVDATSLPVAYVPMQLPKVKNQKSVSSCVAHTTSSILEFHDIKNGNTLSTNFIYGIQKEFCGHEGSGMYLRDACKIVKEYGDMLESDCSGNDEVPKCWEIAQDALNNDICKKNAQEFKIKSYFNCSTNNDIKRAIYEYGPVLCSIKWYDTFKVDKDGVLEGAQKGDYGYHAVMIYGWNSCGFLCQNSWGTSWGEKGRFILPYTIPVAEAKGLVDDETSNIIIPKRNKFLDFIYKIVNAIVNFFKSK